MAGGDTAEHLEALRQRLVASAEETDLALALGSHVDGVAVGHAGFAFELVSEGFAGDVRDAIAVAAAVASSDNNNSTPASGP